MISLKRLWLIVCAYLFMGYRGLEARGKSKSSFFTDSGQLGCESSMPLAS